MTKQKRSTRRTASPSRHDNETSRLGSQTLLRGLAILDAVAEGPVPLTDLAEQLDLTRSTAHRLASALADRRYLVFVPRSGYSLGPKLLELGYRVRDNLDMPRVANAHLEQLSQDTGDIVHMGVMEGSRAMYVAKIPGRRRIAISSHIGERTWLSRTALGKALILDQNETTWRRIYQNETGAHRAGATLERWLTEMRGYARSGYTLDMEENEDRIRCVAAPVRTEEGHIAGAISISCAAQYMDNAHMKDIIPRILETAGEVSRELGWSPKTRQVKSQISRARKGRRTDSKHR